MTIDVGQHISNTLSVVNVAITTGTTPSPTAATGSSFVAIFGHENATTINATTGVTDNFANTYVKQGSTLAGGGAAAFACEWWLCTNGAGGTAHIATAIQSGAQLGIGFLIEVTGGALASLLDQNSGFLGDGTSPWTNAVTTTNANDLLIGCGLTGSNSGTETDTWGGTNVLTMLDQLGNANFFTGCTGKLVVAATGTYTASLTSTSTGVATTAANMLMIALKAATSTAASENNNTTARQLMTGQLPHLRMSPRSEHEAQHFLRNQKRAYGFAA